MLIQIGGDITADESATKGEVSKDDDIITSLKSYSIEASDLTVYGQKNLYNSGNSNPFDYAEETPAQNTGDAAESGQPAGQNGEQNTASQTGTTGTTTPGTFFEKPSSK